MKYLRNIRHNLRYRKTLRHFDNCDIYKKYNQCACLLKKVEEIQYQVTMLLEIHNYIAENCGSRSHMGYLQSLISDIVGEKELYKLLKLKEELE